MSDLENNGNDFGLSGSREDALQRVRTAGTLSISPELFEKLYLTPQTPSKASLRGVIGNPSALGLLGFSISLGPLCCQLMEWRGVAGTSASQVGVWYGMGGVLMIIACILEFIIGNTFTGVSFGTYGGFWIAQAITLTPMYNAAEAYQPEDPANPGFHASFAFALVFMGVPTFIFMICSLRTNVMYVTLFATILTGFCLLAGSYWQLAQRNMELAHGLQITAGAVFFVTDLLGWYIFTFLMLASVEFPIQLPMGDISHLIPPRRVQGKEE
ncbi:uncharacterized protein ASPGLDRAFT_137519 [Aspergillus glaucus CBS 516.65]|uniref:GPR1/FUN34/YaaH-class plasma membrane protein n=1 Tax=Aspergillus glaucus CBS 516.65 TaxID=1160497 RepID=A0A1L9V575_ASPGL|nr:hypothetical protein ASPGLDRAFT_137519 [Aspergillus glaucus CBS 516.65]OJJ79087.1 hypothetical protein ASPGLDRAFT_137519 [Aspergillus glaucus CBS 516.65]